MEIRHNKSGPLKSGGLMKIKITLVFALAIVVSLLIYLLIVKFYVDPFLKNYSDLNRGPMIFEFYNKDINYNKVYYWGPSAIKEGVNTLVIDELDDYYEHYNLGNPASSPLRRVIELEDAISSKPNVVVFGVGYMSFTESWLFPHDQYALISGYVNLEKDPKLSLIYNETFKELLNKNKLDLLIYKRKFIYVATDNKIDILRYKLTGAKKPFHFKEYNEDFKSVGILLQTNETVDSKFLNMLEEKQEFEEYHTPSEANIEKISFEYIIQKLLKNNIKVIILKFPLNPLMSEKIPEEYKNNFDDFILNISNKYSLGVVDYTNNYDSSYFFDEHHLNQVGRKVFSEELTREVTNMLGER
ncbi:hypothetical protein HQ529_03160 [Candidatus Woesearchaeota archaeon]|nr:hypothetical protein [Candidatus Woesearchaeota archaeon]